MHRPLAAPSSASRSSGRLAGWGRRERAAERVNRAGALETARTRRTVAAEAPERSASTPTRFISRTTSSPNRVSPASLAQDTPDRVRTRRPRACRARRMPRESPRAAAPAGPSRTAMRPQLRASVACPAVHTRRRPSGWVRTTVFTRSSCSRVAPTARSPTMPSGRCSDQNSAPTWPSRSRGTSVSTEASPSSRSYQGRCLQRPRQSAVAVGDGMDGEDGAGALQRGVGRVGDLRVGLGLEGIRQAVELAGAVQFVLEVCHGGLRTS